MKEELALKSTQPPLLPIYDHRRFKFSKVKKSLTFKDFCEQQLKCDYSTSPVFLELAHVNEGEIDSEHYGILKRKVPHCTTEV